jgi:hypothetical protein
MPTTRPELKVLGQMTHREVPRRTCTMAKPLYDTDFYAWTLTQAEALRAKNWRALDVDNLAEEIESLGRSDRYAIESQLERLLLHLLKWRDDPAVEPRRVWRLTINHARREIARRVGDSPSLRDHPARYLATAYRHAREDAAVETGLPLATFPEVCPWPSDRVLEADFFPGEPAE